MSAKFSEGRTAFNKRLAPSLPSRSLRSTPLTGRGAGEEAAAVSKEGAPGEAGEAGSPTWRRYTPLGRFDDLEDPDVAGGVREVAGGPEAPRHS